MVFHSSLTGLATETLNLLPAKQAVKWVSCCWCNHCDNCQHHHYCLWWRCIEPNLKLRMQVRLMNFAGLDEAGIDGGGIFREFMSELIKTAFDPNRGFFCCTADKLLYPNPQARLLVDNFTSHYYFLGRILGKVSCLLCCVSSGSGSRSNTCALKNHLQRLLCQCNGLSWLERQLLEGDIFRTKKF